jgi:hypothetical protein
MADRHVVSPYYGTLYQRIQFHGIVMHRTRQAVIPFDAYCPSLQDKLHLRVCSICKQYIPSATRLRNHYRVHQQRCLPNLVQTIDQKKEEEQSSEESDPVDPYEMPLARIDVTHPTVILFCDMAEWLKADFEQEPIPSTKTQSTASLANAMIRKEKQLAAKVTDPSTSLTESIATISLESALMTNNDNSSTQSTEAELHTTCSLPVELDTNVCANVDEPTTTSNENTTTTADPLLEQYDDLNDLLDKL